MEIASSILLILHFIGLASLLGGFLVQISTSPRVVNNAMFHGALLQLITGILLVGVAEMSKEESVNHAVVGVKLVVLLIIMGLVIANRKKDQITNAVWLAIGLLTTFNIVIAVVAGAVSES